MSEGRPENTEDAPIRDQEREYIQARRQHLANEFQRWGDAVTHFLVLGNTGGVAILAGILSGSSAGLNAGPMPRLLITLYALGSLTALGALAHEWFGVRDRLEKWDRNTPDFYRRKLDFRDMVAADDKLSRHSWVDGFFGYAPAVLFVTATLFSLGWLWML